MNTNSTDRRTALAVFFKTAIVGASVPVAAATLSQCSQPAHGATIERTAWDRNLAAYNAALAEYQRFDDTVLAPAIDAFARAEKAVPHVSFTNQHGQTTSTADEAEVRGCRASLVSVRYVERCAWEDMKAQQKLVAAADARAAKVAALPEKSALDRAEAESERLSAISYAAYEAVAQTPVASAALLQEKWAWLVKESDVSTWHDEIAADIARIAARGA